MQRVFTIVKVDIFFVVLEKVLCDRDGNQATPHANMFNVGESEYTVRRKPQRIVVKKKG